MSLALDLGTLFARETLEEISPEEFPAKPTEIGSPLVNIEDPEATEEDDGNKVVFCNQVISDPNGQSYKLVSLIGSGSYSRVYKCYLIEDKTQFFAMKIMKNHEAYKQAGETECKMMRYIDEAPDHPGKSYTTHLVSSFLLDDHFVLILPLYYRSLYYGIGQDIDIDEMLVRVRRLSVQLMESLAFLHANNIVHCDLKCENIMFVNEAMNDIVVADMGSAQTDNLGNDLYIQSRFFRSPEVVLGLESTTKIDIWSAGCVIVELFLDFAIFACDNTFDLIGTMIALLGEISPNLLLGSLYWWKFFNYERTGLVFKDDIDTLMRTRHLNAQSFMYCKSYRLHDLIMEKDPGDNHELHGHLLSFSQFAHAMLEYDPDLRLTAQECLQTDFLNGVPLDYEWKPPDRHLSEMPPLEHFRSPGPPIADNATDERAHLSLF